MSGRTNEAIETPLVRRAGGRFELRATRPGLVRDLAPVGSVVAGGETLGALEVLGAVARIVVPSGVRGAIVEVVGGGARAKTPVAHGTPIVVLDPELAPGAAASAAAAEAESATTGLVFRTPLGGRYYARPSPGADPFVKVGQEVRAGSTIALVEVMKTFHRLRYGGEGLPEVARVARILPAEGEDVARGAPILEVEPA